MYGPLTSPIETEFMTLKHMKPSLVPTPFSFGINTTPHNRELSKIVLQYSYYKMNMIEIKSTGLKNLLTSGDT